MYKCIRHTYRSDSMTKHEIIRLKYAVIGRAFDIICVRNSICLCLHSLNNLVYYAFCCGGGVSFIHNLEIVSCYGVVVDDAFEPNCFSPHVNCQSILFGRQCILIIHPYKHVLHILYNMLVALCMKILHKIVEINHVVKNHKYANE